MKLKGYFNNSHIVAGTTVKEVQLPIKNSMSLHTQHDAESVLHNRHALAALINQPLAHFVCANQTHSDHFYRAEKTDAGRGTLTMDDGIANVDGLYTYEANLVLTILTADCVPVLFYHETNGLIGAIHSGWQGTVKEITKKFFTHLKEDEQCDLTKIHLQIGMALSQEKFEVDEDVYEKFEQLGYAEPFIYYKKETNKYHIDNQLVVKQQCILSGIPPEQISLDPTCTFVDPSGFSHREDPRSGRHIHVIVRK